MGQEISRFGRVRIVKISTMSVFSFEPFFFYILQLQTIELVYSEVDAGTVKTIRFGGGHGLWVCWQNCVHRELRRNKLSVWRLKRQTHQSEGAIDGPLELVP